ncbi:hypothetical protein HNQ56_002535 [Anaerotaenia torta]|uniref:hypothetical protein n=1 Tax=Anaerotaenia torta TaxID=433293 RepID=UPI003D1D30F7
MNQEKWKYYNHAIIPNTAPHAEVDLGSINHEKKWKNIGGTPLLARWTSDFDCGYETNWWWCIKDTPFNISDLKAKRRYEINKGLKNFECRIIDPNEYAEQLFAVQSEAFLAYPEKYRPNINHDSFIESIRRWDEAHVYGAFSVEENKLCGYAILTTYSDYANFNVLKTIPEYEKNGVNSALVYKVITDLNDRFSQGYYLVDGEKSISHETHFQDYLYKYFGFRKAYCKLNVKYRWWIKPIIMLLFPFRRIIERYDKCNIIHNIIGVLKIEEAVRGF